MNPALLDSTEAWSEEQAHSPRRREPEAACENEHLSEELRKAEIVIDIQKKVAALLGRPLGTTDREPQR